MLLVTIANADKLSNMPMTEKDSANTILLIGVVIEFIVIP